MSRSTRGLDAFAIHVFCSVSLQRSLLILSECSRISCHRWAAANQGSQRCRGSGFLIIGDDFRCKETMSMCRNVRALPQQRFAWVRAWDVRCDAACIAFSNLFHLLSQSDVHRPATERPWMHNSGSHEQFRSLSILVDGWLEASRTGCSNGSSRSGHHLPTSGIS